MASEGLSLLALPTQGALLAFGGYNGRYHSSVQMLWPGMVACLPVCTCMRARAAHAGLLAHVWRLHWALPQQHANALVEC